VKEGLRAEISFEKDLFDAAHQLRGPVTPAEYKHYVLPLLFLRYLSLRFDMCEREFQKWVEKTVGDAEERERYALENRPYFFHTKSVCLIQREAHWDYLCAHADQPNIKEILDNAMKLIEDDNPSLRGTLTRIYKTANALPAENIAALIRIFSREQFGALGAEEVDVIGRVYEYFISHFAASEGIRGGEFYTPSSIVKLLVRMLEPRSGIIFDPSCGSGGMFVQSREYTKGFRNASFSYYGQEIVETTVRLARMNLYLHGITGAHILQGDSLLEDQFPHLKADYVMANPPFNMKNWGADRIRQDDPRFFSSVTDVNANYAWMQHFLYHLNDQGTAGFVMANGAMTTQLKGEKEVRQELVERGYIDCIVQLPERLFFTTSIPCCLFFLSKNRSGRKSPFRKRKDQILFIDARKMGTLVSRKQKALSDEEIERIAQTYQRFCKRTLYSEYQDQAGFCRIATIEEVRQQDYKLTPGLYVGSTDAEDVTEDLEEKILEHVELLREQFASSKALQDRILKELEGLL
jgi:type I restriction enzyme M protein